MSKSGNLDAVMPQVPEPIRSAIAKEFAELESRFCRSDFGPAELNGGRLAEAILRYMEWKQSGGSYTAIGTQLNRTKIVNQIFNDASLPDGIRFHLLKCTELMMDIRNKRDIAHLGSTMKVDGMDANLVMRLASWSLSEIVREEGKISATDAQRMIDRFSGRNIPLVEEIAGDLIVTATNLDAGLRALVALYSRYPDPMSITDLRLAANYQNSSRFKTLLMGKKAEGFLHLKDSVVYMTGKGVAWVERNIDFELRL